MSGERRRVVLVSGLSGGGKSSALRELEDLGYEAVDNAPLAMLEDLVARSERKLAIGVDTRTSGFDADLVLQAMERFAPTPRCGRNWCSPGRTKSRCCAAIPRRGGAIRWRRRDGSPMPSRARNCLPRHCARGQTW